MYHFAQLDFQYIGTGIDTMFHHHPKLGDAEAHSDATQAFMAGLSDATCLRTKLGLPTCSGRISATKMCSPTARWGSSWIGRCSWNSTVAAGGNVTPMRGLLDIAVERVHVDFIPDETLGQWVQWVTSNLDRGFSWERLRFMAQRIASGQEGHPAHELADAFVNDASDGLERMYEYIPRGSEEEYQETVVASLTKAIEDYLPS